MARSIEDVLARRTRLLFLNAAAALQVSPTVARILADELNKDSFWIEEQLKRFRETATNYLPSRTTLAKT
jgi:glycerol-3-phosphate dehydrogenase